MPARPTSPVAFTRPRFSLARGLGFASLVAAFVVGTWFLNWLTVPVIAALYAFMRREVGVTKDVAAAASLAWLLMIWRQMSNPAFTKLLSTLGDIFPVPGNVLIAVTLLLAATLAASAARVCLGVAGVRTGNGATTR